MSNSKESTLQTQFSLSIDSDVFEDSALISGIDLDMYLTPKQATKQPQILELLSEIDLINEDRSRLRLENDQLKSSLQQICKKNLEIELLQKIASKALAENYNYRQKLASLSSPVRVSPRKVHIRSPSENLPKLEFPIKDFSLRNSDLPSTNTSPLKSQRNNSSRTRVTRNQSKYPSKVEKSVDNKFKNFL